MVHSQRRHRRLFSVRARILVGGFIVGAVFLPFYLLPFYVGSSSSSARSNVVPFDWPPVLVNHYSPLTHRRAFMEAQLALHGFLPEFITKFDRENLTAAQVARFHRRVKISGIAASLGHIECFRRVAARISEGAVILEDDALLAPDFAERLNSYYSQLPLDWDMLFLGDGNYVPLLGGYHIPFWRRLFSTTNVYLKSNADTGFRGLWGTSGATRGMDSYVMRRRAAQKIVAAFDAERLVEHTIGLYVNELARRLELRVYWAEPTIVSQGSTHGRFRSMTGA